MGSVPPGPPPGIGERRSGGERRAGAPARPARPARPVPPRPREARGLVARRGPVRFRTEYPALLALIAASGFVLPAAAAVAESYGAPRVVAAPATLVIAAVVWWRLLRAPAGGADAADARPAPERSGASKPPSGPGGGSGSAPGSASGSTVGSAIPAGGAVGGATAGAVEAPLPNERP